MPVLTEARRLVALAPWNWLIVGAALSGGLLVELVLQAPICPGNPLFLAGVVFAAAQGGLRAGTFTAGLVLLSQAGWMAYLGASLSPTVLRDLAVATSAGAMIVLTASALRWQQAEHLRAADQARAMLKAFLDSAPLSFFAIDGQGAPFYYNAAARELLGQAEQPDPTKPFARSYVLYRPGAADPYPIAEMPIRRALRGERSSEEMELERPDGERRLLAVHSAPVMSDDSEITFAMSVFEDITARRDTEVALAQASERLRTTFVASVSGLVLHDATGTVLEANPAALHILGITADDLRNPAGPVPDWSFIDEDGSVLPLDEQPFLVALRTGARVQNVVVGIQKPHANVIWALVTVEPLRSSDGSSVTGAVSSFSDITARKQTENELQESREQYRQLVENASDVVYRTNLEGYFTFVNAAAPRLTGRSEEELVGLRFTEVIHPQYTESAKRFYYRQYFERKSASYYEFPVLRPDGRVVWVGQHVRMVLSNTGEPDGFQAIVRDISERRAAEEALARALVDTESARGEVAAILDATPDTLIFVNARREIRAVSRAYLAQMKGRTSIDELVGHPLERLLPAAQRRFKEADALFAWADRMLNAPTGRDTMELTQHWPTPQTFVVSATPVTTSEGEYQGRLFLFRDVTQERAIERLKDELLSMVSHELKNPLTTIMGYTDLLLTDPERPPTPRQAGFLNVVMDSSLQQLGIVNDLLDLSSLNEGLVHLSLAPVNLEQVTTDVVHGLQLQATTKTITIESHQLAGITVPADHQRLTQILQNLLSNAIKYTPPNGHVIISAAQSDGKVCVSISDTGIGMSSEEQEQLFTRFFRTLTAIKAAPGTGLGLAITKALVEAHGGDMGFTSAPGQGTTFWFTLPLERPAEQADWAGSSSN